MNPVRYLLKGHLPRLMLVLFLAWITADFCVTANLPLLRTDKTFAADGFSAGSLEDDTPRCPLRRGATVPMLTHCPDTTAERIASHPFTAHTDTRLNGTILDPPSPVPIVS